MEIIPLNNTQKEELNSIMTLYKFFYVCNKCGTLYGADKQEKIKPLCMRCFIDKRKEKKNG